ncbi:MAG: hypothetical protein IJU76_00630 [Desulfovibrionaceae bacterium]|nr:hypothetical protein [Desulfovibrionaceae bacterium]
MHLLSDLKLVPLSQLRSANKKHGNIGDIELARINIIVESLDAKYGSPYLRDELEELKDKLTINPELKIAGFIVDSKLDLRKDIIEKKKEIEFDTGTKIYLFTFDQWIDYETKGLDLKTKQNLAYLWLNALVESFCQKRVEIAPIDKPCDKWLEDLIQFLKQS